VDFDDCFEYFDGSVFTSLILIGAIVALTIRHWTTRWFHFFDLDDLKPRICR
jgi:hypothetical protein